MSKSSFLAASAALSLVVAPARADEKATCFDAASKGQSLRDAHHLVEARQQLRVCARRECPSLVAKDCAAWLDAVEQGLPTVVLVAKDGAGADLIEVKVALDGKPFASRLDGEALPVDPGPHTLHFEAPDGTQLDQQVVMREGLKNQNVTVVLGHPPPVVAPPAAPPPVEPAPEPAPRSNGLVTAGWIVGAAGAVGLGVGAVFGFKAIADKNDAHCNASGGCEAGPLGDARTSATVSTVGLIAGGVLLAGGAAVVLFLPRGGTADGVALRLAPLVGSTDAGLQLAGRW